MTNLEHKAIIEFSDIIFSTILEIEQQRDRLRDLLNDIELFLDIGATDDEKSDELFPDTGATDDEKSD